MAISTDDAGHIMRRMGFGPTQADIDNLTTMDRTTAVNTLINYTAIDDSALENMLKQVYNFDDPSVNQNFNQNLIRAWWLTRMVFTKRQFQEKMTLFWHNHFATALSKVQDTFMYIQ